MRRNRVAKFAVIVLAVLGAIHAHAVGHHWVKMSEAIVTNQFGQPVKQCVWVCQNYQHGGHTVITQGFGTSFCPMPPP